jgi:hyperosmotically inducible protein
MKQYTLASATILAAALFAGGAALGAETVAKASIVAQLRRELLQLPSYGVYDFLSFACDNGTVTLTGYANEATLKTDAEQAAKRVAGVTTVVDKVEVLVPSVTDDQLRSKLYYAIFNDPFIASYMSGGTLLWGHTHPFPSDRFLPLGPTRFPGTEPVGTYPIHIVVKQGRVALLGVVDSESDKTRAGILAQGVPGSLGVENELIVDTQA